MRDQLTQLQRKLEATPHLHRIGALFSDTVMIKVDDTTYFLVFDAGHLVEIIDGPSKKIPYQFAFVTDLAALTEFWSPYPKPGFHDIFAMVKVGRADIQGDILRLVKNLRFFKEFMALGRKATA